MNSKRAMESDVVKGYLNQKTVMNSIEVDERSPKCPPMILNSVQIKSKL